AMHVSQNPLAISFPENRIRAAAELGVHLKVVQKQRSSPAYLGFPFRNRAAVFAMDVHLGKIPFFRPQIAQFRMDRYPNSLHQGADVRSPKSRLRKMLQFDGPVEQNHRRGKVKAEASLFSGSYFKLLPQRLKRQGVDTPLDTFDLFRGECVIALERQNGLDAEVGGGASGEALE